MDVNSTNEVKAEMQNGHATGSQPELGTGSLCQACLLSMLQVYVTISTACVIISNEML